MPRIKDYSLLIDRNLVTEQELPEPLNLGLAYLTFEKFFENDGTEESL